MPKDAKRKRSGYEIVDDKEVQRVINLFVKFADEHRLLAKVVMLAMEIMASRIRKHLKIGEVTIQDGNDQVH